MEKGTKPPTHTQVRSGFPVTQVLPKLKVTDSILEVL